MLHTPRHFRRLHHPFIARCYPRACPAATPRGWHGESCSTAAGFVLIILSPVAYVSVVWTHTV
jgi:hypothetical protein